MKLVFLTVLCVHVALGQRLGPLNCPSYTGDRRFDDSFIKRLTHETYFIAVSSLPADRKCNTLDFGPDGTFEYRYVDRNQIAISHTGRYTAEPTTFTRLGKITLEGLPVLELGTTLLGSVEMDVLHADPVGRLIVGACTDLGLAHRAHTHALVPASQYSSTTSLSIFNILRNDNFPFSNQLTQTSQLCNAINTNTNLVRRGDIPPVLFHGPARPYPHITSIQARDHSFGPQISESTNSYPPVLIDPHSARVYHKITV